MIGTYDIVFGNRQVRQAMKATGNFENARNVDPMVVLSDATARTSTAGWRTPPDRTLGRDPGAARRAAAEPGLPDRQLIAAVARYLDLPPVWAYEVATFYTMFETREVSRNSVAFCTNIGCWLNGAEGWSRAPREAGLQARRIDHRHVSSARRSAWPPAAARRWS